MWFFIAAGDFSLLSEVFGGILGGDAEEGDGLVLHPRGAAGDEAAEIRHLRGKQRGRLAPAGEIARTLRFDDRAQLV